MMMRPPVRHQVGFSISSVEAWAPGVTTREDWHEWQQGTRRIASAGEPALQQMQPLLRRHAGRLGRLSCTVAYDVLAGESDVPVVFSSRYGEVSRSVELLSALATGEELSPASFGLSVHNAITGLFSMARKDTANTISLAAGDESAEYGVMEACSLLADGADRVLLVVADVPLPDIYAGFSDTARDAFAWACLMTNPHTQRMTLEWSENDSTEPVRTHTAAAGLPAPGALAVLPFLQGAQNDFIHAADARTWHWRRHD